MDTALRHRVNVGRVALRSQIPFFQQQLGNVVSEWKADQTRVTFADFAISEKILSAIRQAFPSDEAFSEESVLEDEEVHLEAKYTWILDPIDGTNNYALGMRTCAISLGLFKSGFPLYGFVFDGSSGALIEGGAGHPLLVDGKKQVLPIRDFHPRTSVVGVHFPLAPGRAASLGSFLETYRIRSLGSSALQLAYAALGKVDGVIDEQVKIWDIAAAISLMAASNREMRYFDGLPFPLKTFRLDGPKIRFVGGSPGFLSAIDKLLGGITDGAQ